MMAFQKGRRLLGIALIGFGLWVLTTPFWAGEWALALLAGPVILAGVASLAATFRQGGPIRKSWFEYAQGLMLLAFGLFLFAAPTLAITNLKRILIAYLLVSALLSALAAWRDRAEPAAISEVAAALASLVLAAVITIIDTASSITLAGLAAGFALVATGWNLSFAALGAPESQAGTLAARHADAAMNLPENAVFSALHERYAAADPLRSAETMRWIGYFLATFFTIHAVRMGATFSIAGILPALAATLGDLLIAVAIFWLIMAPLRLLWRRLTRGLERRLWLARMNQSPRVGNAIGAPTQQLVNLWLDGRYAFAYSLSRARASLLDGLSLAVGQGMIIASLLVAINSIWGFSWYFNTENWASGIYQAVTGPRVDTWRQAMAEAVLASEGDNPQQTFALNPPGVSATADFSFLVIGDPGEGDASQASLKDRYLELEKREEMKFVVISSDVIYPAGEMKDYEKGFYMPFKGVKKPIYAIPGNHDWFNALAAFSANLMTPEAARLSIEARVAADRGLTLLDSRKRSEMIAEAARLRQEYGLATGLQKAPYFDIQTDNFALIAIDTGILKTLDSRQWEWLHGALARARGKFILALTGHPRFAGGADTTTEGSQFQQLFKVFESHGVAVAMAGDTHDFEYYRQTSTSGGRGIHHFLNGGGGAYLSIGTALDWPASPATGEWAYYPSTAAVRTKLERETPMWKRPALWWIDWAKAWPASVETLSGIFDFNKAPFFQSFMEVQVRSSSNEVRFVLHGVNGPLRWRDLDRSGMPHTSTPDSDVVFTLPMRP